MEKTEAIRPACDIPFGFLFFIKSTIKSIIPAFAIEICKKPEINPTAGAKKSIPKLKQQMSEAIRPQEREAKAYILFRFSRRG